MPAFGIFQSEKVLLPAFRLREVFRYESFPAHIGIAGTADPGPFNHDRFYAGIAENTTVDVLKALLPGLVGPIRIGNE